MQQAVCTQSGLLGAVQRRLHILPQAWRHRGKACARVLEAEAAAGPQLFGSLDSAPEICASETASDDAPSPSITIVSTTPPTAAKRALHQEPSVGIVWKPVEMPSFSPLRTDIPPPSRMTKSSATSATVSHRNLWEGDAKRSVHLGAKRRRATMATP